MQGHRKNVFIIKLIKCGSKAWRSKQALSAFPLLSLTLSASIGRSDSLRTWPDPKRPPPPPAPCDGLLWACCQTQIRVQWPNDYCISWAKCISNIVSESRSRRDIGRPIYTHSANNAYYFAVKAKSSTKRIIYSHLNHSGYKGNFATLVQAISF